MQMYNFRKHKQINEMKQTQIKIKSNTNTKNNKANRKTNEQINKLNYYQKINEPNIKIKCNLNNVSHLTIVFYSIVS